MFQEGDPFIQTAADLEALFIKSKGIQNRLSSSGFVSNADFQQIREIYSEAEDLLEVLKDALQVLNERGGKINGHVFTANEFVQRQNTVRGFENDMEELRRFHTSLSARQQAAASATTEVPITEDHFVLQQQRAQQVEMEQQEEVMDRLSHGLQELRATGLNINQELNTQEVLLADVDTNMTTVQARLRSANEKLDHLLASMSNTGKICTICALFGILILLFILF